MHKLITHLYPENRQRALENAGRIVIIGALIILGYFTYVVLRPVLAIVLIAAAIESLSSSWQKKVSARLGGRPQLAAGILTAGVILCVLTPIFVCGFFVVAQLTAGASWIVLHLQQDGFDSTLHSAVEYFGPLRGPLETMLAQLKPEIMSTLPAMTAKAGEILGGVGEFLTVSAIGLFLFVVALFYFYLEGTAWRYRLIQLVPLPQEDVRLFFRRFREVSLAVIVGNVGTALIQGVTATIGYMIVHIPMAMLWGFLTMLASLVPIGTWLVWVPLSVYATVKGGWGYGAFLMIYGIVIVASVDNMLRPLLTRRGLELHPLLVFLSLFGGIAAFGLSGLFVGPLIIALAVTTLEIYERHRPLDTTTESSGPILPATSEIGRQ